MILRGAAGLALALSIGATAHAADCAKLDTIKLHEYPGLIQNMVAWTAIEHGFLKKHCLEAQMVPIPSAPAAYAASIQGGVNMELTAPETAYIPITQGLDVKIVAAVNNTIHYALVVRKEIADAHAAGGFDAIMKALVGKRVGVNTLGSTTDQFARANFTAAGLDPKSASWIAYGPLSAGVAALQNGSLDAAEFFADGMDIAATTTGGMIVGDLRDPNTKTTPEIAALRGASLQWAAPTAWIEANADAVKRFVKANNETIAWIQDPANFEKVAAIIRAKAPSPAGVADPEALLMERVKRYVPQLDATVSRHSLEAWNTRAVAEKRIPKPVDIDRLIWSGSKDILVP